MCASNHKWSQRELLREWRGGWRRDLWKECLGRNSKSRSAFKAHNLKSTKTIKSRTYMRESFVAGKPGGRSVWGGVLQERGSAESVGQQESGESCPPPPLPLLVSLMMVMPILMKMLFFVPPTKHFLWLLSVNSISFRNQTSPEAQQSLGIESVT